MATEWTLSQQCVLGTDIPNNKCLPYKRVFKRQFLNLECNNRPKIGLKNVKTYQFRMFHGPSGSWGPKKGREEKHERTYCVAIVSVSSRFLSKTTLLRATGSRNFVVVPVSGQRRRMSGHVSR